MKVTLKTVQGTQFSLELDEGTKIGDVKAMVQEKQGEAFPADKLLLIYQGKVLKDDTTLSENNVTENCFMVIMVTRVDAIADACFVYYFCFRSHAPVLKCFPWPLFNVGEKGSGAYTPRSCPSSPSSCARSSACCFNPRPSNACSSCGRPSSS